MSLNHILAQATAEAVKNLYGAEVAADTIVPSTTKKEFEGNLTIVVFPFLKASHKRPEDTAQEIGAYLVEHCDAVEKFNVIKGFLNITIKPTFWTSVLLQVAEKPDFGFKPVTEDSRLVERHIRQAKSATGLPPASGKAENRPTAEIVPHPREEIIPRP